MFDDYVSNDDIHEYFVFKETLGEYVFFNRQGCLCWSSEGHLHRIEQDCRSQMYW